MFRICLVEQKSPWKLHLCVLLWDLEHMLMTYRKQNHMKMEDEGQRNSETRKDYSWVGQRTEWNSGDLTGTYMKEAWVLVNASMWDNEHFCQTIHLHKFMLSHLFCSSLLLNNLRQCNQKENQLEILVKEESMVLVRETGSNIRA